MGCWRHDISNFSALQPAMRELRKFVLITVIVLGWRLRVIEYLGNSSAGGNVDGL